MADTKIEYAYYHLQPRERLVYEEDQIEEFARLIYVATHEHLAPNWTMDLIEGGLDAEHLRMMANRWREFEFEPQSFAGEVERLADATTRED